MYLYVPLNILNHTSMVLIFVLLDHAKLSSFTLNLIPFLQDKNGVADVKLALTLWEQFLLCMVRLRRGVDTEQLADMFGVSSSTVSRIFNTWVNLLAQELPAYLFCWPTKEQIKQTLPQIFKSFPKTRAIIDCTEFYIQRPSMPSSQRKTWSSYKQHNTYKLLVACTPNGYISFESNLWTGNASDRKITFNSGFLDYVEPYGDIMADRGFCIRDALALMNATFNIPPFTNKKCLSSHAVTKIRRIARARIHVECCIGRLKCFKILSGLIPLSLKKELLDIIIVFCASLCNMDKKLVN